MRKITTLSGEIAILILIKIAKVALKVLKFFLQMDQNLNSKLRTRITFNKKLHQNQKKFKASLP